MFCGVGGFLLYIVWVLSTRGAKFFTRLHEAIPLYSDVKVTKVCACGAIRIVPQSFTEVTQRCSEGSLI